LQRERATQQERRRRRSNPQKTKKESACRAGVPEYLPRPAGSRSQGSHRAPHAPERDAKSRPPQARQTLRSHAKAGSMQNSPTPLHPPRRVPPGPECPPLWPASSPPGSCLKADGRTEVVIVVGRKISQWIEAQPRPPCDASNHGSRKAEYSGVSARNQTPSSRPPARTSAPSRPTRLRLVGIVNCGRSSTWPLRFARPIPSPTSPSAVPNSLRLVRGPPLSAASSSPRAAQFTPKSVTSSPRACLLVRCLASPALFNSPPDTGASCTQHLSRPLLLLSVSRRSLLPT
jgi:hypothetical protein